MGYTSKYIDANKGIRQARLARILAKALDGFIALAIGFLLYPVGILVGTAYLSFADGLNSGQSLGKRLMGFKVIKVEGGAPCSFRRSLVRNLPLSLPFIMLIVPIWGWILGGLLLVALVSLEIFLIFQLDRLNRLGDVMAETTVVVSPDQEAMASSKNKTKNWLADENLLT